LAIADSILIVKVWQNFSATMPTIHNVPVEILQKILIYGCEIYEDPFLTEAFSRRKKPPYLSSARESWPTLESQLKSFADAPKYVCQLWKQVVSSTPGLWYIDYTIDSRFGEFEEVDSVIDTLKVEIDFNLIHLSEVNSKRIAKASEILRRNSSRIRMINVIVHNGVDQLSRCLEFVNNLEKLPNLEFIKISASDTRGVASSAQENLELTVLMPALRVSTFTNLGHPSLHIFPKPHALWLDNFAGNLPSTHWREPSFSMSPRLRCLNLDMRWDISPSSIPVELPTLDLPFLMGLRIRVEEPIALELLSRMNLPRVTSMVICCDSSSSNTRSETGASSSYIFLPSLEIFRIGGSSYRSISHKLKDLIVAPKLRAVQIKADIQNQLRGPTAKAAEVSGWFADHFAMEDTYHRRGFAIELSKKGDYEHREGHAVVSSCGEVALDLLGFFPDADTSSLTIRRPPCCRPENAALISYDVASNSQAPWNTPNLRLKHIHMPHCRGDHIGSISQKLVRHATSACIQPPESTSVLKSLFQESPALSLHFALVPIEAARLKPLGQLNVAMTPSLRSELFEWIKPQGHDPDAPKPRAVIAQNLKHLRITLKPGWISGHTTANDDAVFNMLTEIITARKSTKVSLESLTVNRSLAPRLDKKLTAHCKLNGVRYSVGEIDCSVQCSAP
jgi:hypothetical protein